METNAIETRRAAMERFHSAHQALVKMKRVRSLGVRIPTAERAAALAEYRAAEDALRQRGSEEIAAF